MKNIKKSLVILTSVKSHRDIVDKFARNEYKERFKGMKKQLGTYHAYSGYEVISESELKVKFSHGAGDMDFDDYFIVEI